MQTLSSRSPNRLSQQSRKIAVFAILLFALSGLISGFAMGAFVRPKIGIGTKPTGSGITPVGQNTKTAVTTTLTPTKLGWPVFTPSGKQIANGTSLYTLTAQVVDQSIDPRNGYPVHASGITCKIWLTKDGNINDNIQADNYKRLKSVDTLNESFPGEIVGALNFDPGTQQTQPSNANGQATWKYTVAPFVAPGDYFLVVLADWNGAHYNWSWAHIEIKNAG